MSTRSNCDIASNSAGADLALGRRRLSGRSRRTISRTAWQSSKGAPSPTFASTITEIDRGYALLRTIRDGQAHVALSLAADTAGPMIGAGVRRTVASPAG